MNGAIFLSLFLSFTSLNKVLTAGLLPVVDYLLDHDRTSCLLCP